MALTQEQQNTLRVSKEHLKKLPSYVTDYYEDKKNSFSINTLLRYIYHYDMFFNWLISDKIVDVALAKDVPLDELDSLKKSVVKTYFDKLTDENIATETKQQYKVYETRKDSSLNGAKTALRSLFKYLVSEAEHDNGDSYIERNVMEKFPLKRIKVSPASRAAALNGKILKEPQIKGFIDYILHGYQDSISDNHRKLAAFLRDKERDFAIISLFLGSGIRLSELVSLEVANIDFKNSRIAIIRKGGNHESVAITIDSLLAIEHYLIIRNTRYKGAEYSPFLFVSNHGGIKNLSIRAIQNTVNKYTQAYLQSNSDFKNQNGLSPHKLRHSFSLVYYENNDRDIKLLSEQLGHSNLNTTGLYVNMADGTRSEAIERVSEALNYENEN